MMVFSASVFFFGTYFDQCKCFTSVETLRLGEEEVDTFFCISADFVVPSDDACAHLTRVECTYVTPVFIECSI